MDETLHFNVGIRDNRAAGGGVNYASMQVTVSGTPFALANRATPFTWNAGTAQTVTWTVGGGSVASNVNILLSTNGGTTFTALASNVPNTGSATVTVPAVATTQARLEVQAVGNVFFDVSRVNSTINNGATVSGAITLEGVSDPAATVRPVNPLTFVFKPVGGGAAISSTQTLGAGGSFSISSLPPGNYTLSVKGDKWLRAATAVNASAGNVAGVTLFLPAGDANNDNSVDSTDFGILIGAFGSVYNAAVPNNGYDPTADFNNDGSVDSTDFGLLIGEFNVVGSN